MLPSKNVVYPRKISDRVSGLRHDREGSEANAKAIAASFRCGSSIRVSLTIDADSGTVSAVSFSSNGCGFMIAAADVLAETVQGKSLTHLHGLTDAELNANIQTTLGVFPVNRRACLTTAIESLRAAFADHRLRQIEEYRGEKALICTCFGVTEETIEDLIAKDTLTTVDEVADVCRAGSGCGSCRMLIQEMLDG